MNVDSQDLAHACSEAEHAITAIACSLNTGDKLFDNLIDVIGYGRNDARLRAWCRAVQKHLERQ